MLADDQMERFRRYLTEKGLKFTHQRKAIAEVFFEGGRHFSLTQLLELSRSRHASVGYATVYRTMKLMTECHLASEHKFSDGQEARYEPAVEGQHHDHLICLRCATIIEFEDEAIEAEQDAVAERFGFLVVSHRHEIYGVCSNCQQIPAE